MNGTTKENTRMGPVFPIVCLIISCSSFLFVEFSSLFEYTLPLWVNIAIASVNFAILLGLLVYLWCLRRK